MRHFTLSLFLLAVVSFGAKAQLMFDSLLVYYAMDGNAKDSLGSGIDGTVNGATPTIDPWGNADKAYNFGTGNTSITIPNDAKFATMNNAFTISLWLQPSAFDTYNVILAKMNGGSRQLVVRQQTGGAIHTHFEDGGLQFCTSGGVLQLNEWQHIAITFDGSDNTITMYHNGVEVHSCTTPGKAPNLTNGGWNLGTLTGGNELWKGDMDDLLMWNRTLTAAEVAALYNLGGKYNDLLMCFPMNGEAEDLSPLKNNGTVDGATFIADRFGVEESAVYFDGVDDMISIPHDAEYKVTDLPLTFSTWIWIDEVASSSNTFFTTENRDLGYSGLAVTTNTTGSISASYMINGCACSQSRRTAVTVNPITEKEWHHVAVIFRGANDIDIYIDSVMQAVSYSGTGGAMAYDGTTNADATLGAYDKSDVLDNRFFKGALDDVKLYNRELTAQEIKEAFVPGTYVDPLITSVETSNKVLESIGLFPNPFDENITLQLGAFDNAQIDLFDATGSHILSKTISSNNNINVEELKKGLYIARITLADGTVTTSRVQKQ